MKYTLRQLEVFLAAANHENLSRAADNLAMSQSAASSALKDLEQQFDIRLFDRIGKRLQINELGQLVRPRAEAILAQAKELEDMFRQHLQVGNLTIGATLTIGNYLCAGIMARYREEQPQAKLSLVVANTEDIVHKVEKFELDIGLIEGEIHHNDLEILPWCDDELVIFCSPKHPYAQRQQLCDDDLLSAQWIIREPGSGTRQSFDRGMSGLLPKLNVLLELQHTEAIKHAVDANLGLGCLSKITLEDDFQRGSLVPLHLGHRHWKRQFYFILHKQKYRTAGISHWIDLCRQLRSCAAAG
ncbi:MAG: LysR family transcriptional regulator [Cellvibrionaceae bacterium]|nr:LysR family transcriptional regulator [Cellvibrionaceae bacterium]